MVVHRSLDVLRFGFPQSARAQRDPIPARCPWIPWRSLAIVKKGLLVTTNVQNPFVPDNLQTEPRRPRAMPLDAVEGGRPPVFHPPSRMHLVAGEGAEPLVALNDVLLARQPAFLADLRGTRERFAGQGMKQVE